MNVGYQSVYVGQIMEDCTSTTVQRMMKNKFGITHFLYRQEHMHVDGGVEDNTHQNCLFIEYFKCNGWHE
jgi:hypothetical protein